MDSYLVPAGEGEAEYVEKRSRFIGHMWRVESEEEARSRIEETRKRHYDARLEGLRERLEAMRTPENSATMDQIRLYLTASVIHGKARKLSDSLAGVYRLRGIGDYCDRIRYDAYDPGTGEAGLARLIGKAFTRYGFTCYEAIRAIEEDTQAALNKFQEDFNSQIQEEILVGIVEPIQAILSRLQTRASQLSA